MKTYKSNKFLIAGHLFYSICAGAFLAIALEVLTTNTTIIYGACSATIVLLMYRTFLYDYIKIEVDDEVFKLYRMGKLKRVYELSKYTFDSYIKDKSYATGSDSDCHLSVTNNNTEQSEIIDCSTLGQDAYYELLQNLGISSEDTNPIILID